MKIEHSEPKVANGQVKLTAFIQLEDAERLASSSWMDAASYKKAGERRAAYSALDDRLRARAEQHGIDVESSAAA